MKPGIRMLVSTWAMAALLSGCATTMTKPDITIAQTQFGAAGAASAPAPGATVIQQAALVFARDLYDSASAGQAEREAKALAALRSGRALLDLRCSKYLDDLGIANQEARYERQQVDIVGGFTSAIMGLTGSGAKAVAGVASTFSFAGASMDARTTTFLFSDASKSITKLVRDAQHAYILAIEDQLGGLDHAGMVSLLTGYEQLCRPSEIRRLIDEAVAASTIVAEVPGGAVASTQLVTLLGKLTGSLQHFVDEGDAIVLYAWFTDVANRQSIKDQSAFIKELNLPDDKLAEKLSSNFLPLALAGNLLAKRWADAVTKVAGTQAASQANAANAALANAAAAQKDADAAKALADRSPEDIKAAMVAKAAVDAKLAADEKAALESMKPVDAKAAMVAKAPAPARAALSAMTPETAKSTALTKAAKAAKAAADEKAKADQMTPEQAKQAAQANAAALAKAADEARSVAAAIPAPPPNPKAQLTLIAPSVHAK